jgi:hypothetical protein
MSRDEDWLVANQRVLMAELTLLRERLEGTDAGRPDAPPSPEAARALAEARAARPGPSALDGLSRALSLSAFERTLLLLCVGVELDGSLGAWCARANGDARQPWPTLGLALSVLPGAHWSALAPEAPLRRLMLVAVEPSGLLTASPLRVAERTLHHLLGLESLEERLVGLAEPLEPPERLRRCRPTRPRSCMPSGTCGWARGPHPSSKLSPRPCSNSPSALPPCAARRQR